MTRRTILGAIVGGVAALAGARWTLQARAARRAPSPEQPEGSGSALQPARPAVDRLELPKARWRELLDPEAYAVLFEENTERAFTSPLNGEKHKGTFVCAACFLPLFLSDQKFDSGTGWPSFYDALPDHLGTKTDFKLVIPRTEYHCARCGGHQGHVFSDGPPPTGKRYCNNGLALRFVLDGEALPEVRQG
jgi:peptide-methionine (R)-S-oxide reductase